MSCSVSRGPFQETPFNVLCPPGCQTLAQGHRYGVTGTTVYEESSYICMAAVHAGATSSK